MKNLKKTLAMISSVALAGSVFAACGNPEEPIEGNIDPATSVALGEQGEGDAAETEATETEAAEGDTAETEASGSEGGKLTVLCWNTDDINPMIDVFCEQTGHTADEFNVQNFGVGGSDAAEQYDLYLGDASNDADIMFVEADWALKYINDDSAETGTKPLSDIGVSSDYSDLFQYTVDIGKSTSGVQKGLSWQAAPGGFCYRTDLAEQYLGVTTPEDFQALVSDWDKFMDTAAKVKEASGGTTALVTSLGDVSQVFFSTKTSPWVVDGKLTLDDSVRNYIDMAKTMYDEGYVIPGVAQWGDGWLAAGVTDTTMGYFVSTWGFGDSILTSAAGGEGGDTYGKWNCVVGPQDYYWGGTWMTVASRCDNPELAKEFIEFFTVQTDNAKIYATEKPGGEYVSNKTAMADVVASYEGLGVLGGQNHFAVLNDAAQGIDLTGAITPYDSIIKTAFNDAVNDYCTGVYASVDETVDAWVNSVAGTLGDQIDYSNFDEAE